MNIALSAQYPVSNKIADPIFSGLTWLAFVLLGALPLLIALFPADAAGWVLLYLTYALLMAFPDFRQNSRLALAGVIVLTAHHLVSLFNAYLGTVIGGDLDAASFHRYGTQIVEGINVEYFLEPATRTYVYFLASFYRVFGSSHFLGEELSDLAFTLSCVVLVKLCNVTGISRFQAGIVLMFGLSVSGLIFLSITLRESWQVLFVLLSAYWALRVRSRMSLINVFFLLFSAIGLGVLHNGLSPYAVFLVIFSLYWGIGTGRLTDIFWKRALLFIAVGLIMVLLAASVSKLGGASAALASGKALEYAQDYRLHSVQDARAAYGVMLDASSLAGLAMTLPVVVVQYMFAPFPWQISSPLDIEAMLEGIVRMILLYTSWRTWRLSIGEAHSQQGFLLILFLTMEFLWSLGTINWGTAVRHHVLAYSLLVLTGGPGFLLSLNILRQKSLSPRTPKGLSSQL